ncbi:GNAT family N-acetyltransferase [Fluviicola taffensis]|uniref:GCN5-related N-acetyltransferase n=1 Tax=Fluviicola taffensis (strain DSM 16823 / NCIMB 13979 / RW262) TaxID=755732 RepID=F2IGE9_FLUTR|nr:GNAT family N-acetyltransferase [Fluviicola taffensis]AEA45815.1 GCN5-related N-acetyltransferase [Fluviicola taffensis DSM 16823]
MIEVKQFDRESKGFFKATEEEVEAGRMTYSWVNNDRIIIDHTEVNPAFRGKSVGNLMVQAAVEFARKAGIKIIPLCPFAKSVFDKTPDYHDVL